MQYFPNRSVLHCGYTFINDFLLTVAVQQQITTMEQRKTNGQNKGEQRSKEKKIHDWKSWGNTYTNPYGLPFTLYRRGSGVTVGVVWESPAPIKNCWATATCRVM